MPRSRSPSLSPPPPPPSPAAAKSHALRLNESRRTLGMAPRGNMDGAVTKCRSAHAAAQGNAPARTANRSTAGRASIRPVARSRRDWRAGSSPTTPMSPRLTRSTHTSRKARRGRGEQRTHAGSAENALVGPFDTNRRRHAGGTQPSPTLPTPPPPPP
ncbi:Os01g0603200 [Oryza sativa Japonica Group]|uniref:Os01g0603200 protein n=1 Tax=Oryza sativa subsp. japonica TaxID=39947 RepID=Q0JLG0_ORYSJ|nr:Os01g0603200 [Oryza sativa Japonica Group]|eukprot:NP_001043504.1 Os01g0603200 [Oryza sativa Japonica Group]